MVALLGQLLPMGKHCNGAEHDDVEAGNHGRSSVTGCNIRLVDLLEPDEWNPRLGSVCMASISMYA